MKAHHLGILVGAATLLASGTYVFIYLYRWEWNRALTSGMIFIAAEVALATILLNERIRTMRAEIQSLREDRIVARLHESPPPGRDHFAWLNRPDRTSVFVPVLMSAGILISGLAWAVERVAKHTLRPRMQRDLAHQLVGLSAPEGGFLGGDDDVTGVLRRPRSA